jgi:hypothetical protein
VVARRRKGSRRRRSRRAEELDWVETHKPALHEELLALRHVNPQGYRKRLRRLVRDGTIPEIDGAIPEGQGAADPVGAVKP